MENNNQLLVKIMEMKRAQELRERQHEADVAKLNHRIRELEHDNSILLDLLAQVMKENSPAVVLREENFGKKHQFRIDENVGGEPLLIIIR
jgi:broad-specificity NMP kinase